MNQCCLCNAPFSANFRGASFIQNTDYRLCLKCAAAVRTLTKFDAKSQEIYEDAFYLLHKKLLINKYPRQITEELFRILQDVTTYSDYLNKQQQQASSSPSL